MSTENPRLYFEFADWWPVLSSPADYVEEAAFYRDQLFAVCAKRPRTLLELGSGGGNNASHMKAHFDHVVLVDRAPGMLAVSRALNPECEHVEGDMRTVRLGREFDCVFIHDAICYLTTEADVRAAIATAFLHCRPGGAVLLAPDHVRETYRSSSDHGGEDGDGRSLRYLEWSWDPDPDDTTYEVHYAYLLRESDGSVRVAHDRHLEGLFPRADWLRWLADAGFEGQAIVFDHSELEPGTYEVFVARKPSLRSW
jgi:hypothetical protein